MSGNGDGTFQNEISYGVGLGPRSIVAGDFNRDGRLDLALANNNNTRNPKSDHVSVLLNITSAALLLLTEEGSNHVSALDSVTFMRAPFPLVTTRNFSADQQTRIALFAVNAGLMTNESMTSVTAQAEDSQQRIFPLTVEYVGQVPDSRWLTQVNVKLPRELINAGDVWISISLRGAVSNKALLRLQSPDSNTP